MGNPAQRRVQAGVPTGGQFSTAARGEADIDLTDPPMTPGPAIGEWDDDKLDVRESGFRDEDGSVWGDVSNVREGSRTPWGAADHVEHPIAGIVFAGTPGHGGFKLSPERNRHIPPALRNQSGWYEEDCESYIVMAEYPQAFPHLVSNREKDGAERPHSAVSDEGWDGVARWFPQKYEQATGRQIPFGVSAEKDQQTFYADKDGQTLVYTTGAKEDPEFPGYVNVTTRIHGHGGGFTQHLIPVDSYNGLQRQFGAARVDPVLPEGSIDITPPAEPAPAPEPVAFTGIHVDDLTPSQQERAAAELNQRYRMSDGSVRSFRDLAEAGHVTGKTAVVEDGGKLSYHLEYRQPGDTSGRGPYVHKVSAATFKAVGVPDSRTESELLHQKASLARARAERARRNFDFEKAKSAKAEADRLFAESAELSRAATDAQRQRIDRQEQAAKEHARRQFAAATGTGTRGQ